MQYMGVYVEVNDGRNGQSDEVHVPESRLVGSRLPLLCTQGMTENSQIKFALT